MKKRLLTIVILFLFTIPFSQAQNYDYLTSNTATNTAITPAGGTYGDVVSLTLSTGAAGNISKVLVVAGCNMKKSGISTSGREVWYNITNDINSDVSGEINRQVQAIDNDDYGSGTLVHVFDVSAINGDIDFTLEHKNTKTGTNRDVETTAYLTAIALTTELYDYDLSSTVSRIDGTEITTTSPTFVGVTGLVSSAVTLPIKGSIYVAASVNGKKSGSTGATDGQWELEYKLNSASTWTSIGKPVLRTMSNTADDGMISLVAMVNDLSPEDYVFRVAHRRASGVDNVVTHYSNLVVVALTHEGGGYFPSYSVEVGSTGVSIVGEFTTGNVTSTTTTAVADISSTGPSLFTHSQLVAIASNLNEGINERLLAQYQLFLDDGGGPVEALQIKRLLATNSDYGSCGFISLAQDLTENTAYTLDLDHTIFDIYNQAPPDDETLKTFDVILCGFQTYDQPVAGYWTGASTTAWGTAANWADVTVPTSSTNVYIPDVTLDPIISGTTLRECTTLEIASGATLDIEDDAKLTVSGALTNNGTLTIESTPTGTGSLIFGSGTPNATVQRYLTDNMWHSVTPVTTGVTVNDFHWSHAPESWLLTHDESQSGQDSWSYMIALSTALNVGQGYMVWLDDNTKSDATATMVGNLQSADLAPTLAYTNEFFNLIGNPFSSAIDRDLGGWGSNTSGIVYVWDNAYNGGDYRLSPPGDLTDNIIPMGQGFFVDATSASPFTIPAAARVHSTQAFYKSGNSNNSGDAFVRIQLDGNGYGNTVFIGFPENGTNGMDYKGDARKLYSSDDVPQLFAIENNIELCINSNKPLSDGESKTVPMHLVQIIDGEYSLTVSDLDQLEYNSIMLEDVKTGITQDLRTNPVYLFAASVNDAPERFLLHFKKAPFGLGQELEQASNIQIFSSGNELCIRSTEEAAEQGGELVIYDLMGRELLHRSLERGELVRVPLNITSNYVVVKVVKGGLLKTEIVFFR